MENVVAKKFKLLRKIGSGSFGIVHLGIILVFNGCREGH